MQHNNKFLMLLVILLLSPLLIYGLGTENLVSYYSFDEGNGTTTADTFGGYTGRINGAVWTTGKIGNALEYTDDNVITDKRESPIILPLTINFWAKGTHNASAPTIFMENASANNGLLYARSGTEIGFFTGANESGITKQLDPATFNMFTVVVYTNGTASLFIDGVQKAKSSGNGKGYPYISSIKFGQGFTKGFNGVIDEFSLFNKSLNSSEINELYNNGSGYAPINPSSNASIKNISFLARNIYNSTFYISSYNLEFNGNGTIYSTINGTIYLNNFNSSNLLNVTLTNATNHNDITYLNINVNTGSYVVVATNILNMTAPGITSPTAQNYAYNQNLNISWTTPTSYIGTNISSYNISLLNSDLSFNRTINGSNTGLSQIFNLSNLSLGSYYIKIVAKDIYNLTNQNTSAQFNISSLLGIKLQNNYTLAYASNFSGYVISNGVNISFTDNNGSATINIYSGLNQIYIYKSGYSVTGANYFNFTLNSTPQTYNKTFQLYTNNSIYISIKDEITYNLITENISVELTLGNVTIATYYTTNGTLFLENLTDGSYNIDIGGVSSNYTARNYVVSVANGSTQTLNAFLSSSLSAVIFVIMDSYSSEILEDATISLYKYINGSLALIEIKNSDITGRAQFNYIPLSKYRIVVQKTGYISKSFDLDPILFASYDVFLDRNIAYTYTGSLEDVKIIFSPSQYYANETTNFLFIISSSTGVLNNYGVNLSYPCGNKTFSGNNSIGELYNTSFMISCAKFRDTINITYYYQSVGNPTRYYFYQYYIGGTYSASNYTFINLRHQGDTFGLGALERIIIVTILGLIVAGVTFLMIGGVGALVLCLLVFSYFTYTGFIPLWSVLISMVAGVFLLIGRDP